MPPNRIFPYVEDAKLIEELLSIISAFDTATAKINHTFHDNIIDPFSALIESACHNISFSDWQTLEKRRQIQKTLQNTIGYFHQRILGSIEGWSDPGIGAGFDSENRKKKIFAEIKNKYNTLNAASARETYNNMVRLLDTEKQGHNAYVVIIIPKRPARYKRPFAPSNLPARSDLLEIDGASYYEICTGDPDALRLLYKALPDAIIRAKNICKTSFVPEVEKYLSLFGRAYS